MPLTDKQCQAATCPADKARSRFFDAGGLYLEAAPNGSRRWFWKYLFAGKEKRLALGRYPDVSLKQARELQADARKLHSGGTDPVQQRQVDRLTKRTAAATTFEAVARELHGIKAAGWSQEYAKRWLDRLEKDLFPWLGAMPLVEVTAPLLLQALRRVEARGVHETAHTLRENAGQIFRYGVATGRCERNPAADLRDALKPVGTRHFGAVTDPDQAAQLLRDIDGYTGQPTTRAALLISALTFQRPGNTRAMLWSNVDLEAGMWTIPAAAMKRKKDGKTNGRPHLVPLAPQAVAILKDLRPLTRHSLCVFPSTLGESRCISENTLRTALRRLGYSNDEMTAHGFRAMARTLMVEKLDVNPEVIEAQLAHGKSGPLGMAYDRSTYMQQRREMMVMWADYLDKLRKG